MGRKVFVVGSGGREHALAWRLAASPSVDEVASAPGNPGMAELGPVLDVDIADTERLVDLVERRGDDLVVVGPEVPLVAGLADALRGRGIPVFGPGAAAAQLEGSKAFSKQVMLAAGVPTAGYVATSDRDEAYATLERFGPPFVVKADGLAAGKGVRICDDLAEARGAVDDALVHGAFGAAGARLVIEQYLEGPERSVFGVCDGRDVVLLCPAQDYKRALDGDRGRNTGGMGAYTPVPGFGLDETQHLVDDIFRPVLREMERRGTPFRGLLYAGLVDTGAGGSGRPGADASRYQLLEFNVRFGDPETQVIVPRLASDLGDLLAAAATGSVRDVEVAWHDDAFVTVVLASGGYPGSYRTGVPIEGIGAAAGMDGAVVFHAGTRLDPDHGLVTAGGRVCNVVGRGPDVASARATAYAAADRISWDGLHRREDIAAGV